MFAIIYFIGNTRSKQLTKDTIDFPDELGLLMSSVEFFFSILYKHLTLGHKVMEFINVVKEHYLTDASHYVNEIETSMLFVVCFQYTFISMVFWRLGQPVALIGLVQLIPY